MWRQIKNTTSVLTIFAYTNMVLAEDVYRDLPKTNDIPVSPFILWQQTLVVDIESYRKEIEYNRQFVWDLQDNLDPIFGI